MMDVRFPQPGRIPLSEVIELDDWRDAFVKMLAASFIDLHLGPAPFVATVGERPETSAFARFAIGEGATRLPRLDHAEVKIEREDLRALLMAANGERTIAEIARAVDGVFPADEVEPALNAAAAIGLMRR